MKILLVSAIPPPAGGVATWTTKYLDFCKENDINVDLVNTALNGVRGEKINSKRNIKDEIFRTMHIFKSMNNAIKKHPDIVHINSSCSTFGIIRDYICALIAHKNKIPIIIHCHCNIEDQVQKSYGVKLLKRLFDISSRIIVLNKKSYYYAKNMTKTKIDVIPNFIESEMIVENHKIKDQIEEVVFVGHVQPTKGCIEILNVAKKFKGIHFRLVGPVNDEIKRLKYSSNITLDGVKKNSEVKKILFNADVYLFPSYTEGFSLSLVEAMANGLPCIASNVGANLDMLENKGGIIVPTKNEKSIIDAFNSIKSRKIREEMSRWNVEKVKRSYVLDKVITSIFEIYNEVKKECNYDL